jgi:hypothetical protein
MNVAHPSSRGRRTGAAAAILAAFIVLAALFFFASSGHLRLPARIGWADTYYGSLAEGFFQGRTSMAHEPDPRLVAVADPYIMELRADIPYLWDASYFEGRYYLYFSPVPVLALYMPWKLVTGAYPSDSLAAFLFAAAAFLIWCLFIHRVTAREAVRHLPRALWILTAGFGTLLPFVLVEVRIYEVAITCGMAMAAAWALMLVRFLDEPSLRRAAATGFFLALAIATRPNLVVLLVPTVAAVASVRASHKIIPLLVVMALPACVAGTLYAAYNEARFRSPFELGVTHQLTTTPMRGVRPCSLCSVPDATRFVDTVMHYVALPPQFFSRFPFVSMRYNDVDKAVSFRGKSEQVAGLAAVNPLLLAGTALAVLLALSRGLTDPVPRAGALILGGGWLVLAGLSTCFWMVARYELDFLGLMLLGSVVCMENGLTWLRDRGVSIRPLRAVFAALACVAIVIGTMLGFSGRTNAFERQNPGLFGRLAIATKGISSQTSP